MLESLVIKLSQHLQANRLMITSAESCTGGLIAGYLTALPGSSNWFERGFVTYSNEAKHEMLDVPEATLKQYGAVSTEVAEAMAKGALHHSQAQVSLAVTGIAGPGGGSKEKPVGTVCFGFATQKTIKSEKHYFSTSLDRAAIRLLASETAFQRMIVFLETIIYS